MTEMDISLIVFVLLQIFKTFNAEKNCSMQYCQICPTPQACTYCELGRFGQKCENQCQANNETCSLCRDWWSLNSRFKSKEVCFGCKTNEYVLNGTCVPCHEGYFGTNCSETCPENCLQCDSQVMCTSCRNGWSGEVCQCSPNCKQEGQEDEWCGENGLCLKGCKSGTRGERCDLECVNKDKCLSCNRSNGECLKCSEGWYGSSCNKKCGHCQPNKEGLTKCNISTGECNDTCVDGYYGLLCDKRCGQCLPNENARHLNSSKNCDQISGNCSFGCKQGWFGETCEHSCRSYCFNRTCYHLSGKCSERCVHGWHGDLCEKKCNHTCANGSCDAFSSICKEGCVSGWYGSTCNEMCNDACANMSCDQDSGYCDYGCVSGWYGPTCNKTCNACINTSCYQDFGYCDYGCVSGRYGEKCEYRCSKSCKDDICDRQTAECSFGCRPYFKGPFCNDTGTLEMLLNPVFTKVIIGTAGSILLIACLLVALLLVRKRPHGKQSCSSKKSVSSESLSLHQHNELYQDSGCNTQPVYEDIDDAIEETSFTHASNTESDFLREKSQVTYSRNCTSGIYQSPWDLKRSAHMTGATGTWSDNTSENPQTDESVFSVTISDDCDGDYEVLSPAEDSDMTSKANHFDDIRGKEY